MQTSGLLVASVFYLFCNQAPAQSEGSEFDMDLAPKKSNMSLDQNTFQTPPKKPQEVKKVDPKTSIVKQEDSSAETEAQIRSRLSSVNQIIGVEFNKSVQKELRFQRLNIMASLARLLSKKKAPSAEIQKIKSILLEDSKFLLGQESSDSQKARIFYLRGKAWIDFNLKSEGVKDLAESVRRDPASPNAVLISVLLGDYYFENQKYRQSVDNYLLFFNQLALSEKSYINYRIAYSLEQLKDFSLSELYYLTQVNSFKTFNEESVRRLADISSKKNMADYFSWGHSSIRRSEYQDLYFIELLKAFIRSGNEEKFEKLANQYVSVNKSDLGNLFVLSLRLKGLAGTDKISRIKQTEKEIRKLTAQISSDEKNLFLRSNNGDLLATYKLLIIKLNEMYRTEKNAEAGAMAIEMIQSYLSFFNKDNNAKNYIDLWIGYCVAENIPGCLERISAAAKLLKIPLQLEERILYEKIVSADPGSAKSESPRWLQFSKQIENFLIKFPNTESKLKLQRRMLEALYFANDLKKAEIVSKEIILRSKAESDLLNYFILLEKQHKYADLVRHVVSSKAKFNSADLRYIAEKSLYKDILQARKENNSAEYRYCVQNLSLFQLSTEKVGVVMADYFDFILEKVSPEAVATEYVKNFNLIQTDMKKKEISQKIFRYFRSRENFTAENSKSFLSRYSCLDLVLYEFSKSGSSKAVGSCLKIMDVADINYLYETWSWSDNRNLNQFLSSRKNPSNSDRKFLAISNLLNSEKRWFKYDRSQLQKMGFTQEEIESFRLKSTLPSILESQVQVENIDLSQKLFSKAKKSRWRAFVDLEDEKTLGQISQEEYYRQKLKLVLAFYPKNEAANDLIQRQLEVNHLENVLKMWRSL